MFIRDRRSGGLLPPVTRPAAFPEMPAGVLRLLTSPQSLPKPEPLTVVACRHARAARAHRHAGRPSGPALDLAPLQLRPRDAQARINLGVSLVGAGQLQEAIAEFRQALAVEPSNEVAKRMLALAEADLQRATAAGAR